MKLNTIKLSVTFKPHDILYLFFSLSQTFSHTDVGLFYLTLIFPCKFVVYYKLSFPKFLALAFCCLVGIRGYE